VGLTLGLGVGAAYVAHQNKDYLRNTGNFVVSEMYNDQASEGACLFTAASKTLIQNMFQFLYNFHVDQLLFKKNNCSQYSYHVSTRLRPISDTSIAQCSSGGYLKLLIFHYLYYLFFDIINPHNTTGYNTNGGYDIGQKFFTLIQEKYKPRYFYDSDPTLRDNLYPQVFRVIDSVEDARKSMGLTFATVMVKYRDVLKNAPAIVTDDSMFALIKRVTDLGFYIVIAMYSPASVGKQHAGHAVTIVATENDHFIIKNSWGSQETNTMKVNGVLQLGTYNFEMAFVELILPFKTFPLPTKTWDFRSTMVCETQSDLDTLNSYMQSYDLFVPDTTTFDKVKHIANATLAPVRDKVWSYLNW